ncbi:MAG TPA: hypothetical protein DCW52_08015 [Gammaproteobacteria bacterium]|jgi:redox-sensitive bicupin YhaK (pirin superfamily)|nr:hypothetical protein [Gammaproteobacteria bacterium]
MYTPLKPAIKDIGEFSVARVLPNSQKRMVGPFVFFDHMGPAEFSAGQGVNVRPHPHIGLATLTYLIEGKILHRDSLGNCLEVTPGDVNWMVAGKGITHSERETLEHHSQPHRLDGVQCWVALPKEFSETAPSFTHLSRFDLPHWIYEGVSARIVIGEAYGMKADIETFSPMFLVDVTAQVGAEINRPNPQHECLAYLADGALMLTNGEEQARIEKGETALIDPDVQIEALEYSRLIMLGGEAWNETPHLYWNFVAFDEKRLEQAKVDWQEGRFDPVIGDDEERIPLPDS